MLYLDLIINDVEVHPQLCAKDGDFFLETFLDRESTAEPYVAAITKLVMGQYVQSIAVYQTSRSEICFLQL